MALSERLELDLNDALRGVSRVDDALAQMSKRFKASLAAALDPLTAIRVRDVDAREVTRALDRAIDAADTEPEITADARDVTTEVDRAIDAADTEPDVGADADAVTVAVDEAIEAADLEPDITADADAVTVEVESAIEAADTEAEVTADASDVTSALDAAVSGADLVAEVDGDASFVADAIDSAVSAGYVAEIEGDATAVADAIDQAVADTDATVVVDADTSAAVSAMEELGQQAEATAGDVGVLERFTSGAGGAAELATGAFGGLAATLGDGSGKFEVAAKSLAAIGVVGTTYFLAAVDADTATRRFTQGLNDFSSEVRAIRLGGLNEDLSELAIRTGNSDEALLLAGGRLGELGKSAGATESQIADLVQQVSVLAIRATTLNPTLGQAGDVADALANAFARGGRALAPFGISLSAAEINARALRDTGKGAADELTIFEKSAAGAALATERLGKQLATDINEGAQGAEVRLRSLREQVGEIAEAFGQPIIEPALRAFGDSIPIVEEVGRAFGGLATNLIPLLIEGLGALGPVVGVTSDLLGAFAPVIRLVTDIIEAIPDPLLASAAAFLILQKATVALTTSLTAASFAGAGALATGVARLGPIVAGAAAAFTLYTAIVGENNRKKQEAATAAQTLTNALLTEAGARDQAVASQIEEQVKRQGLADDLRRLGVTYLEVAVAARSSGADQKAFGDSIVAARKEADVTIGSAAKLERIMRDVGDTFRESASAALDDAVAKGLVSAEAAKAAEEQNRLNDGTVDYFGVLQELLPEQADLIAKHGDAASSADRQEQSESRLAEAINRVIDATLELTNKELANERARLALRESTARLTEAQEDLNEKQNSGKATTRELEEAQRRLEGAELSQREAVVRLAESQAELANKQINTGDAAEAAKQRQYNLREAFESVASTLAPGSELRRYLEGLADKVANLPDRHLFVTADADQALSATSQVNRNLNSLDGRVVSSTVVVNAVAGTGLEGFQSGGHLGPGRVGIAGEAGPELIVGGRSGLTVLSHQDSVTLLTRLVGQQTSALSSALAGGRAAAAIGPVIVNEVAADPRATAFAVTTELGRLADR